ncbi:Hypothetical protein SCF082_LOCUS2042 [Durusdinium trenchii]|uniref:Nicotinamidase n=1 Tax=Durusdinium trenchii TaxID=1381693 RepID=A0ABP0HI95_9DINO
MTSGSCVCATRDYHPHDHCSFMTCGGPFPPHCLQGSMGSYFEPRIGAKLTQAIQQNQENVMVAFKAFHEHIDSFGAFPYFDGGDGRLTKKGEGNHHKFGVNMGCAKAPFTGSVVLKQSALSTDGEVDVNAPPDVLAVLDDGVDRNCRTLHDVVKTKKRIFVCGLALDFCVLDTCLNAMGAGLSEVYMVLDAARAAHIPGVGTFGSGFLSDPSKVAEQMTAAGVKAIDTASLSGVSAGQLKDRLVLPDEQAFPQVLAPLGLALAQVESKVLEKEQFQVALTGKLSSVLLTECTGQCSPCAKLPSSWPKAPKEAVELCWADPLVNSANAAESLQKNFLAVSASPELCFLAYGGFLLLDAQRKVVAVQAVTGDTTAASLQFGAPRKWREAYTQVLRDAGRFKRVTLPALLRQGACEFAWVNPKEDLLAGPEHWVPSETGAYVYILSNAPPVYFPVEAEVSKDAKQAGKLTDLIRQDLGDGDNATDQQKVTALLCKLGCETAEVEALMRSYTEDSSKAFSLAGFMAWMWNV